MSENLINQASGVKYRDIYTDYWLSLNEHHDYEEQVQAYFIDDSLRRYKKINQNNLDILDLGCGRGWLAPIISEFGSYTGVDFSPEAISIAREKYGEKATFILSDGEQVNWGLASTPSFDVIVCSEVIEHVVDQTSFIGSAAQLLKKNGILILTTPNGNLWTLFEQRRAEQKFKQPIENWLTPSQLVNLLNAHNFTVIHHEGGYLNYRFPYLRGIKIFELLLRKIRLYRRYAQLILPCALYQMVVVQRL